VNFALLVPGALAALAALILPLLIHLSRRSEQRPTDFAALRWISAQLRPRRKLVFQEILLLLLRLLLLIAMAFFLAQPVSMQAVSPDHWVMVVPGADIKAAKLLSSEKTAKWHWLAPGFPDYEHKPADADLTDLPVGSLLRDLDSVLPAGTKITVLVPEQLSGLDGERIKLSRKIDWQILPGSLTAAASQASRKAPNNLQDDGRIHLAIRYDNEHADSAIYFKASHAAWQSELAGNKKDALDIAGTSSSLKPDRTALIWLASGELPGNIRDWISRGGSIVVARETLVPELKTAIPAWRNENGDILARIATLGNGRVLQWQKTLRPDALPELLNADFPAHLKTLLLAKPVEPTRGMAISQAPLTGNMAWPQAPQSLQNWFALLIVLLFALERWLANAPRRWSTA